MRRVIRRLLTASLLSLAAWLAPAQACDVPVYRYALEHWNPDPYQVTVLHRGPMDAASEELVAALERKGRANLVVRTADGDPDSPRIVVRFPEASRVQGVAWEGPLTPDAVASLTDSPCRHEIARRLLAGDAVVWVLLQTGRKEEDEAAAGRIQQELGQPAAEGQTPAPSSMVCVARGDTAEKLLTETLLSSESDLRGRDEPMAFPVFGRGRVLYALVGAGVNAENVRHTLAFLTDGCSCTIKRQNPGVDLLLSADWSVIAPTTPEETAPPAAPADEIVPLTPLPAHPTRRPAVQAEAAPARGPSPWLIGGATVAAALVVLTGWLVLRSGSRSS